MAAAETQVAAISAASGGGKGISFLPPQLQQLIELVVARRAAAWALQVRACDEKEAQALLLLLLLPIQLTHPLPHPFSSPRLSDGPRPGCLRGRGCIRPSRRVV